MDQFFPRPAARAGQPCALRARERVARLDASARCRQPFDGAARVRACALSNLKPGGSRYTILARPPIASASRAGIAAPRDKKADAPLGPGPTPPSMWNTQISLTTQNQASVAVVVVAAYVPSHHSAAAAGAAAGAGSSSDVRGPPGTQAARNVFNFS